MLDTIIYPRMRVRISFFVAFCAIAVALLLRLSNRRHSTPPSALVWNTSSATITDPRLLHGSEHCTIPRILESELTPQVFAETYWRKQPLIVTRANNVNHRVQEITQKGNLLERAKSQLLPLAKGESYAFRNENRISLADYLSNSTFVDGFSFGSDVLGIADEYVVPSVVPPLRDSLDLNWSFQLAIGRPESGLAFHTHGDVFAEVLHGSRRWFLTPPEMSPPFNPRHSSGQWVREIYPKLRQDDTTWNSSGILECTMSPNEALYVPAEWFHSTLSLGEAISLTMSFAATYRIQRYQIHDGIHARMLDALEGRDFHTAAVRAREFVNLRPQSFHSHAWLGVILTLAAQTMTEDPNEMVAALQDSRKASGRCTELNPYYAPCFVWQSRQLEALAQLLESDELRQEAAQCRARAQELSHENDDEILDPRWQPKSMRRPKLA